MTASLFCTPETSKHSKSTIVVVVVHSYIMFDS